MERWCFAFELVPGVEGEYDRMHAEIWPELLVAFMTRAIETGRFSTRCQRHLLLRVRSECRGVRRRMVEQHADLDERWQRAMAPFVRRMFDDDDGNLLEYPLRWHLPDSDGH